MPIELPCVAARVVLYAMARKVNAAPRITVNVRDPRALLNGLHCGLSGSILVGSVADIPLHTALRVRYVA